MTEPEILSKTIEIVSRQFSLAKEEITDSTNPDDVENWDSLSHVSLVSELESTFQVRFEIEEIMEMENVGAMAQLVARKLKTTGEDRKIHEESRTT